MDLCLTIKHYYCCYIYEVAFISHTYIVLRVINVSSPMPEAIKSHCLSSSDSTTS